MNNILRSNLPKWVKLCQILCALSFLWSISHIRPSYAQKLAKAEKTIVAVEELQPENGGKAPVNITMVTYSDNSIVITGKGTAGLYDRQVAYTFDLEKRTYRVVEEKNVPLLNDVNSLSTLKGGRVRVVVKDPVAVVLSQTMNELWWNVDANGSTVTFNRLAEWCNASNPSSAGTKWFTLSCDSVGAWRDSGNTRILNYSEGIYENWNWLIMSNGTWSKTSSTIIGRGGAGYDFTWSYESWGESYRLLNGTVYVN